MQRRSSARLAALAASKKKDCIRALSSSSSSRGEVEGEEVKPKKRVKTTQSSSMLDKEKSYWAKGCNFVVGVDEAGRGPLAGPVVVAGCSISPEWNHADAHLINDSKKLNEAQREHLFAVLTSEKSKPYVKYEISIVTHLEIDEMNILQASLFGMDNVIAALTKRNKCDAVLVDGPYAPPKAKLEQPNIEAIKSGDAKVRAIAAASIIAKVTRDRIMIKYHEDYPHYGFDKHKGYGVKAHMQALNQLGPCPIHRRSYAPVRNAERK